MDRDDGVVAGQAFGAVGALHDGEAQQERVGKQADKANGSGVFPFAVKQELGAQNTGEKAQEGGPVKAAQEAEIAAQKAKIR